MPTDLQLQVKLQFKMERNTCLKHAQTTSRLQWGGIMRQQGEESNQSARGEAEGSRDMNRGEWRDFDAIGMSSQTHEQGPNRSWQYRLVRQSQRITTRLLVLTRVFADKALISRPCYMHNEGGRGRDPPLTHPSKSCAWHPSFFFLHHLLEMVGGEASFLFMDGSVRWTLPCVCLEHGCPTKGLTWLLLVHIPHWLKENINRYCLCQTLGQIIGN